MRAGAVQVHGDLDLNGLGGLAGDLKAGAGSIVLGQQSLVPA
jgi:hypothetical protein